jgi:hypothetical protein
MGTLARVFVALRRDVEADHLAMTINSDRLGAGQVRARIVPELPHADALQISHL